MTVEIIPQDIGDFYYMVRWFTKNKGNTFAVLIDRISRKGTWESNPWVWAYTFELLEEE